MYISELIPDFLESLEIEKGRSTRTIENYRLYLNRFFELCLEDFEPENDFKPKDITPELLRKYRLRLNRFEDNQNHERLTTLTQSYHLIALRGFLKYLAKRGINSLDPVSSNCLAPPKSKSPSFTTTKLSTYSTKFHLIPKLD